MSKIRKFKVYLAGPITGCKPDQVRKWRDDVKQQYDKHLEFTDPTDVIYPNKEFQAQKATTPPAIVEADLLKIEDADGLLVNMWCASIGSTCGVIHAKHAGKPVVAAEPIHLNNKTLAFYADAVVPTPELAAETLLNIFCGEADWNVLKSTGEPEPFDRRKLMASIRAACRGAQCDSIVGPGFIFPAVIDSLKKSEPPVRNQFPTSSIDKVVLETLRTLENNAVYRPASIEGVSEEWMRVRDNKYGDPWSHIQSRGVSQESATWVGVDISSPKSHGTIWGKTVKELRDIPSPDARRVFDIIRQTRGITRITLGRFGHQESRSSCKAIVSTSNTPCVIEGKLFDRGPKGTRQTFQVRVQFDSDKREILQKINAKLEEGGLLA